MLVTTVYRPSPEAVAKAKALAEEVGGRWAERGDASLPRLARRHGDAEFLVVSESELRYIRDATVKDGASPALRFHPGMAMLRVRRLMDGGRDPLVDASGAAPGDAVIDCTAGLASDAIVLSFAVGAAGNVVALESEPIPALLIREGLSRYQSGVPELDEAMRRIRVVRTHHLDFLRRQPADSADIVYFDPMFRIPLMDSTSIQPLRSVANSASLTPEAVREARRIARKAVVMKDHRAGGELERLGFAVIARESSNIAYGVIRV